MDGHIIGTGPREDAKPVEDGGAALRTTGNDVLEFRVGRGELLKFRNPIRRANKNTECDLRAFLKSPQRPFHNGHAME